LGLMTLLLGWRKSSDSLLSGSGASGRKLWRHGRPIYTTILLFIIIIIMMMVIIIIIYILLHIYIYHCIYAIVHIQMYTRHPRRPGTSTCPAGPAECLDCDHTSFIGLIYRTFYIFNGKKHGESCRFSQQNQSSESSSLWVPYFQTNRFAWW
jgi:hypothetical protein